MDLQQDRRERRALNHFDVFCREQSCPTVFRPSFPPTVARIHLLPQDNQLFSFAKWQRAAIAPASREGKQCSVTRGRRPRSAAAAAAAAAASGARHRPAAAAVRLPPIAQQQLLQIGTGWVSEVLLGRGTPPGMRAATCSASLTAPPSPANSRF